jgi:hypothetical protein
VRPGPAKDRVLTLIPAHGIIRATLLNKEWTSVDEELLTECADWIAEQMSEEGYLIDGDLIELILRREQDAPVTIPHATHDEVAQHLLDVLAAEGVNGVPDVIDERMITGILQWEDDFLGFAGRPRA